MRNTGKILGIILMGMLLICAMALPALSCVGKTLVVGSKGTAQQDILAEMLAVLIGERTGTTVKVVRFESTAMAHDALLKADLDMYVEYTGVGQVEVLKRESAGDAEALFKIVKDAYNQELNLVWLKPFGFEEASLVPKGVPAQAAPLVRKDTLKKYPALARLIEKLGGKIDRPTMTRLEAEAAGKAPRDVAREFLKSSRLI